MYLHQKKLKKKMQEVGLRQTVMSCKLQMAPPNLCSMLNGLVHMPVHVEAAIKREIQRKAKQNIRKAERVLEEAS